jgi:aminopeptidase N
MSVVSAPWSLGGFMEYPMLAQIGETPAEDYLDIVVAHEIGHTWLYGILANDERSYPWLDEGLNTFFERKYTKQYYPDYREAVLPDLLRTSKSMPDQDALQHLLIYKHQLQPPASDPQFQSSDQYLFSAYLLPAVGLEMIESRLGQVKMKAMFRKYFEDRQFTHVHPVDLQVSFEKEMFL